MDPSPFLNDALVRSTLTRQIAALETSTRQNPSQSSLNQLNDLTQTYHGILGTPTMKPKVALDVLSQLTLPPSTKPASTKNQPKDASLELQQAMEMRQRQMQTISNIMRSMHDASSSIIQNLK